MSGLITWKSTAAALMTIAINTGAVIPWIYPNPAQAQFNFNQPRTITIPANVTLPVTYEKEKIILQPGERIPLTLRIANDIMDSNRNILIPANSEVTGELTPVNLGGNNRRGVRFVATELVFPNGKTQPISANSRTITKTETITKGSNTGQILTDAAIGAGAATLIALVTGNKKVEVLEPIGGAAAGALASVLLRKNRADVFVLRPEQDLAITLTSNLVLSR
ncbi:conjugal transfer protein TrbI [Cylindrospermopsis raciborskii]|uniref:conjugal transfer protein TrbI n=1 Tax=Cylindrospermopsis raciborskii TaxID=77022 RepID=UPI000E1EB77D|nr:conjugal transfer protein TrbI [Cylindrospermopsis raciborskii]TPX27841.1 conjugal transfer protein TrbI [Cylindrospermopsis raciborskii GIHE 2018]UJL34861.1 conjugal transfer protein TrbI [Cylindrospermopsis raciborskii Cr2010]